jgi:hypothetical protein
VGGSQPRAVGSCIRLVLSHAILLAVDSTADAVSHWTDEVVTFHNALTAAYQRSMRLRIDMDELWRLASWEADAKLRNYLGPLGRLALRSDWPLLTGGCPIGIDEIVSDSFQLRILLDRIKVRIPPRRTD